MHIPAATMIKRMNGLRAVVVSAALALSLGTSMAQVQPAPTPEALGAANELFSILSVDLAKQLLSQMNSMLWPMVEKKARDEKIDDDTIAELRQEFERTQLASLTEAMKEAPPIYARHFTVTELNEMIAFYRTPTGTKAMRELPLVMSEFTAVLGPRVQDMQRQAGEGFDRILRQHGYLK
jgi:hypothetical protein